jgi:glycosyl transferase family 9 (putative heptosyltransferase)
MGFGDQLMASGLARGAEKRGKRIAFGDGQRIRWDMQTRHVLAHNPNVAPPGNEACTDIEWIHFYKGHRIYNTAGDGCWIWNYDFRPIRGQMFFLKAERIRGARLGRDWVIIEPNPAPWKSVAANKDWGLAKYQAVADALRAAGHRVVQFETGVGATLTGVDWIKTVSFRDALALMANAALYIGPEGGLHHGAAAVGIPAVVLFGGFVPPQVTGYETHTNLTGGAEACGRLYPCAHCRDAMAAIAVEEVLAAATGHLAKDAA